MKQQLAKALICVCAFVFSHVHAVAQAYEYHADARMQLPSHGPVDDAYGYLYVETDADGNGTITAMFSNASEVGMARFNAHVKFLDPAGAVVGEELFACWIDREGMLEAIECKLSRPLAHSGFESIKVDFYLSDLPAGSSAANALPGAGSEVSSLAVHSRLQ